MMLHEAYNERRSILFDAHLSIFMNSLSLIDWVALVLVMVGALNWGLVAAFDLDLVATLFGDMTMLSRIVYGLVGLSAIYVAISISSYRRA